MLAPPGSPVVTAVRRPRTSACILCLPLGSDSYLTLYIDLAMYRHRAHLCPLEDDSCKDKSEASQCLQCPIPDRKGAGVSPVLVLNLQSPWVSEITDSHRYMPMMNSHSSPTPNRNLASQEPSCPSSIKNSCPSELRISDSSQN